ncbi:uncharacterized protein YndB with AHSA1/START domain [Arthrobacter sp. UYCu511]|uniref:SRPBCC family protein n=1 Tax=Arthrobacter sp. UYCu511 TaxID=3156337 RepID=UPI0033995603
MTVTNTTKSTENLSLRITAEFSAAVERVWQIWEDPRQLERWWGPPTWPATFERYEFHPGGKADYFMTGPDGTKARGWWKFTAVAGPSSLELDDGFADEHGSPVIEMSSAHMAVAIDNTGGGTRMSVTTTFESAEQMEKMLAMGMEEGISQAMGQIDAILAG